MQKPTLSTALSIFNANAPLTMTLKEITDLLKVRHDNAMRVVENMAENPDFGIAAQIEERYNSGRNTLTTYALDKRQSIAVAAKLNTSLLMRIIDRWQELEGAAPKPLSQIEQVRLLLESLEANERLNDLIAKGKYVTCAQMRAKYPWARHWLKGLQESCKSAKTWAELQTRQINGSGLEGSFHLGFRIHTGIQCVVETNWRLICLTFKLTSMRLLMSKSERY